MQLRAILLFLVSLALGLSHANAGGDPKDKASITFHLETDDSGNPKMIFPQIVGTQTRYFQRTPDVTIKDMASYTPFPADNGEGIGIVIRLKPKAVNRVAAITNMNQRRWLISIVNGRVVDGVMIDKQIDDGVLVIWKGLNVEDLAAIDKVLPRTGQEGKKKN